MAESIIRNRRLAKLPPRRSSSATARALLQLVRDVGDDADALMRRAGLPHGTRALLDPHWQGQLSRAEFARLYAHCTWALDAHASAQEGRDPLTKAELDMLCYCVITCRTLREAIGRTADFSAMLMPRTGRLSLEVSDGVAIFRMATFRTIRGASAFVSDLTGLATHLRLFGWLIGDDIRPAGIEVFYPALLDQETAARLLPHPIRYRAPENLIRFPAHYLDRPVVRSYSELVRFLEHFPFDLEEAQSKIAPLSERLRLVIAAVLADGSPLPTGAELARQFSISPATLRRRLSDEGVSLLKLKDAARRELAERLLTQGGLTVAEIAARVGFSDPTTFSRAFRGWTGAPPRRWARPAARMR